MRATGSCGIEKACAPKINVEIYGLFARSELYAFHCVCPTELPPPRLATLQRSETPADTKSYGNGPTQLWSLSFFNKIELQKAQNHATAKGGLHQRHIVN